MSRREVLDAAAQAVMHDRNADYAPPEDNFRRIADLWNIYLEGRDEVTPYDTAIMMVLVKVARIQASPHVADHLIDIAGYAACAGDVMPPPPDIPAEGEVEETSPAQAVAVPVRCTYEGEPGQFNSSSGETTWYSDTGRKVTLTQEQWSQAEAAGALKFEEAQ